jgi:hypothetical protein
MLEQKHLFRHEHEGEYEHRPGLGHEHRHTDMDTDAVLYGSRFTAVLQGCFSSKIAHILANPKPTLKII